MNSRLANLNMPVVTHSNYVRVRVGTLVLTSVCVPTNIPHVCEKGVVVHVTPACVSTELLPPHIHNQGMGTRLSFTHVGSTPMYLIDVCKGQVELRTHQVERLDRLALFLPHRVVEEAVKPRVVCHNIG